MNKIDHPTLGWSIDFFRHWGIQIPTHIIHGTDIKLPTHIWVVFRVDVGKYTIGQYKLLDLRSLNMSVHHGSRQSSPRVLKLPPVGPGTEAEKQQAAGCQVHVVMQMLEVYNEKFGNLGRDPKNTLGVLWVIWGPITDSHGFDWHLFLHENHIWPLKTRKNVGKYTVPVPWIL